MNLTPARNEQLSFIAPAESLEVIADADVVVVGGGPGGFGAALAAARRGAKTVIVERFGVLGGTWTSGILGAIMRNSTVNGIFAEFRQRMETEGGWRWWNPANLSSGGNYDSEIAKLILDQMVSEANIDVLFFAQLSHVFLSEDRTRISAIGIQSKEGRHAITGKVFVDASGDGDLAAMAQVPFRTGREEDGAVQPMTMIFKMGNVDSGRAHQYHQQDPAFSRAWKDAKTNGEVSAPMNGILGHQMPKDGQWGFNATRLLELDGTKLRDVSRAMLEGRRQVAEISRFLRKRVPGFENAVLDESASHVGVRESRRIMCDYTMTIDDIGSGRKHADAIARGDWYVDIHNPKGAGFTGPNGVLEHPARIQPPPGDWYDIPYRSTTATGKKNLLVASRCLDTTHEAHAAVRLTNQICAVGEGVGCAAAQMAARQLSDTREVAIDQVQTDLRNAGALI